MTLEFRQCAHLFLKILNLFCLFYYLFSQINNAIKNLVNHRVMSVTLCRYMVSN